MKDKVSIQLCGGLCNNLFQIACAYAYSLKHNKELVLVNEKFGMVHNSLNSYKDNILSKVNFVECYNFNDFKTYQEPFFHYQEIPFIEGNVLLNGYYQSEKYFKEYTKEIKELFSFPENILNNIKEKYKDVLKKDTCSIHIRRGDYLNLIDSHPIQSINYYMRSIKEIGIDKNYVFFSDDIAWCKQNFDALPNRIFIENQKDYEDLLLMSMCESNILSNSSFSWWGSYFNNINKKVIAPSVWFGKSVPNDTKDLYSEHWIKI